MSSVYVYEQFTHSLTGKIQVAFYVYMSQSIQISFLSVNKTLVYDQIETNVGNGYHMTTGYFVAPEDGVYAFQVTTVAKDKSSCSVELVKNELVKDVGWADASSHYGRTSSSTFTVLNLKAGDIMKVRVGSAYGGNYERLSFSGFKIV
jgi:hypothetical protein